MYILGINAAYHESAACLMRDDAIVAAAEEERFTRFKHAKHAAVDNADHLPVHAIAYCLAEAGLSSSRQPDLSAVSLVGYSFCPDERRAWHASYRHAYPVDSQGFGGSDGEQALYASCLRVPARLREWGFRGELRFLRHHVCHAASSFLITALPTAAVLVVDGIGEHECSSLFRGSSAGLEPVWQQSYPHSLGFLWEKIARHLGFSEYDAAKVMALAAYGDPTVFRRAFAQFVTPSPEIHVDDGIVCFRASDHARLERVLGVPQRSAPVDRVGAAEQPYADVAASLQEVTEQAMLALADRARAVDRRLCLSGGVALNCAAVGRILASNRFERVYVPSAAHDAGTAIGAALYLRHEAGGGGQPRRAQLTPYLGPGFAAADVERAVVENGLTAEWCPDGSVADRVAALLADGAVVAWFEGRMEFGPRALGHRSVFADPRTLESVRKASAIKHRAAFDPFAPSVLEEAAADWFELSATENLSAHYMVATYRVRPAKRRLIPAVVHIDGTSRAQIIRRADAPVLHRMIHAFWRLTGVPMVLNTSFNDCEPIVCGPADALGTALRAGVDHVVLEDRLVDLSDARVDAGIPDIALETYFEKLR